MHGLLKWTVAVLAMASIAGPARAAWHEAKSKHFVIYSNGPAKELQDFAIKLEKFDKAVRIVRRMEDPPLGEGGRLTVYVLPNAGAVAALFGAPKSSVAGFYEPRASGSIAVVHRDRVEVSQMVKSFTRDRPEWQKWVPVDPETVFFHEYFHHLMLSDADAAVPKWMVEGFAEYFSTASLDRDGSMVLGVHAGPRIAGLYLAKKVSLEEMLAGPTRKLTDPEIDQFYGRGWLLTHYLSNSAARSGQLQVYIAAVQQGKSSLDAARQAFGDLNALDIELDHYLRSRDMGGYRVPASALQAVAVELRPLTQAESEMLPVRMRSDRGVDANTAPKVAADARAVAAKYPNDAFVQGALAEAELDAGNIAAAIAAADRALAADPGQIQSLIYKGRALMAQAAKEPQKAKWDEIRSWFSRANKRDSENPEPLMLFYLSYVRAGEKPTANAVDALLYAVALAPQDMGLRRQAVQQLLIDNRAADATQLFGALAFSPHQPEAVRERNAKVMQAIVAGDSTGALKLMREPLEPAKELAAKP